MTHLSQDDNHLDTRSVLIAQHVVGKHRARISGGEEDEWLRHSTSMFTQSCGG